MRNFFVKALLLLSLTPAALAQPKIAGRYDAMIDAPKKPEDWPAWRQQLAAWRDSVKTAIHYQDAYYRDPQYKWQQSAYSTFFLVATEQTLFDKNWNYQLKQCLKPYEEAYGGVDIVLLWPTYPQLGWDNRDQYTLYRGLPGGTARLRQLADELHAMGKKLMIAYNPWDNIGRNNGKNDEEELIKLVREINADGIFLDTIDAVEGFRKKLDAARPGVIFQAEINAPVEKVGEIHQSWCEEWFGPEVMNQKPALMRNRWLEQRHTVYQLMRWSHEQTNVLQSAWLNGCGLVLWENVFGTWVELNDRDRAFMRRLLPVMRQYSAFFTEGEWTPLYPCRYAHTYASQWKRPEATLYTIAYRLDTPGLGKVIEIEHQPGTEYYDLTEGKKADVKIEGNKALISMQLVPRDMRAILSVRDQNALAGLQELLPKMAAIRQQHTDNHELILRPMQLTPVSPTKGYATNQIPPGMVRIPVPADSLTLNTRFRNREPGFYAADGFLDHSLEHWELDKTVTIRKRVRFKPFAMDATPVTNAQFYAFTKATGYKPAFAENFLKGWKNGKPAKGEEQLPVVWITLDDARAYAKWAGKRLPTEEEWQWAAQSGEKGFTWPWGNTYDSTRCNYGQFNRATPVKQFENGKTPLGLYDMTGNVWQWTESERTDSHNRFAIVKGGAWYITHGSGWYADQGPQATDWSAKYLFTWPGLDRCATIGFRCVADLQE